MLEGCPKAWSEELVNDSRDRDKWRSILKETEARPSFSAAADDGIHILIHANVSLMRRWILKVLMLMKSGTEHKL